MKLEPCKPTCINVRTNLCLQTRADAFEENTMLHLALFFRCAQVNGTERLLCSFPVIQCTRRHRIHLHNAAFHFLGRSFVDSRPIIPRFDKAGGIFMSRSRMPVHSNTVPFGTDTETLRWSRSCDNRLKASMSGWRPILVFRPQARTQCYTFPCPSPGLTQNVWPRSAQNVPVP